MEKPKCNLATQLLEALTTSLRRFICTVLSIGPIPNHVAFIMDGNRRYAKKRNLQEGSGHKLGYSALTNMLQYCYELNIKHVTIYAFSIDNFNRRPEEVQSTMNLIQEKIEGLIEEESIVNRHGVKVNFIGNLKLLTEPVQLAAERAMKASACNSRAVLSICLAYTSTDEITHGIEESCREKRDEIGISDSGASGARVGVEDVEKHLYMAGGPEPDIIIRTSGETRLSNFLLWQSACSVLYSPRVLWPEIGFRHLLKGVLEFQRNFGYLERKRKQS